MDDNKFKCLTDEIYELYRSFVDSGFSLDKAFELTKTYCSIAFVNQSIMLTQQECSRKSRREILNRYVRNRKTETQDSGTREGT